MAFSDDINDYFDNYIFVPASFSDDGDTGLATGNAYLAIRLDSLTNLSAAQAAASAGSSSFRQLCLALIKKLYDSILEITAADRPTKVKVYRRVYTPSAEGTDAIVAYEVRAEIGVDDGNVVAE